jgi:serine/threonine protein kinase/Tfp pilus assembly protein PilF
MTDHDHLERLKHALQARYTIERELGRGGMAVVYLAEDVKHHRKVAVKVLRPELAAAVGAERFLNEIRVTANLQHPHILPLHDSGDADGFLYYVMPYVEGESLREKLNREKQLPIDDALRITTQVADALHSAHQQSVVHRDIKPENILLRDGHALVADFGIALAVSSAGGERLTETGLSLGTPAYMSPEQVAGDREIDARSDIYSLACVLYEMLAGDPPFVASTSRAVLAKHVTDPVPPITTVRASVPPPVATAIKKALGKVPADRFASAKAFLDAMLAETTESEPEVKSIVVLPFENMSADPDQEYFSDGLTEEIINAITHVDNLKVIARTSAFEFKNRHEDVRVIGQKLGVDHLLEGSVRKVGNRLRITAQLIKTADGSHLWSERYDREMEDVFAVQDEISLAIVDTLKVTLLQGEREALTRRYTDNVELYNLYLLGRHYSNKFTPEGFARSAECFEQAIQRDPTYALAYAGAAEAILFSVFFDNSPPLAVIPTAKAHVKCALELDPCLAEAHALAGRIAVFYDWERYEAKEAFERALSLDPQSAVILQHYADFLSLTDEHEQANVMMKRALELDPLSSFFNANTGERIFHAGRFDEAIEVLRKALSLDPDFYYSRFILGCCLKATSRLDEAIVEFEAAFEASGKMPLVAICLANSYWRTGAKSSADAILHEIEEKAAHAYVPATTFFAMYHTRGEKDRAFRWFERALQERDFMVPFCMNWPDDDMRFPGEVRYTDRLREVGLLQ